MNRILLLTVIPLVITFATKIFQIYWNLHFLVWTMCLWRHRATHLGPEGGWGSCNLILILRDEAFNTNEIWKRNCDVWSQKGTEFPRRRVSRSQTWYSGYSLLVIRFRVAILLKSTQYPNVFCCLRKRRRLLHWFPILYVCELSKKLKSIGNNYRTFRFLCSYLHVYSRYIPIKIKAFSV